jgi:hypothetical protein
MGIIASISKIGKNGLDNARGHRPVACEIDSKSLRLSDD